MHSNCASTQRLVPWSISAISFGSFWSAISRKTNHYFLSLWHLRDCGATEFLVKYVKYDWFSPAATKYVNNDEKNKNRNGQRYHHDYYSPSLITKTCFLMQWVDRLFIVRFVFALGWVAMHCFVCRQAIIVCCGWKSCCFGGCRSGLVGCRWFGCYEFCCCFGGARCRYRYRWSCSCCCCWLGCGCRSFWK